MGIKLLITGRTDVCTDISILNLRYCSSINTTEKGRRRVKFCDKTGYILQHDA